jgi:polyhydroxyalkanoate synthesis repressor PhaR
MAEKSENGAITIKKYANRRLYNTATSSYVTLDHLCQMVKEGIEFTVYDAKTSEDITRSVLTQIIVEEEAKGQNLLPISFLRQLIRFYGDSMQWLVPRYLELTMQAFAANQDEMRRNLQEAFGGLFPFGGFEEMSKQNMAMFEKAMRMFSPFPAPANTGRDENAAAGGEVPDKDSQLDKLRQQVDELQRRLEELSASRNR